LATSLKGIDGGDQIGAGVKLAHVKPQYTQGSLIRTEQVTDLAINGNGFFAVDATYGRGFTRDGNFHFDNQGNLITSDDYKVLGYAADENGKIANKIEPIRLTSMSTPARATQKVKVNMNLDSRADVRKFDIKDPNKTSNYNSGLVVYDNVGTARMITLYFNKTKENTWEYHATTKPSDAAGSGPEDKLEVERLLAQ
jgi:flagellar hook protein FlgE